ncbi:hypothetical protein ACR2V0_28955, partial [Klebsiella pneumoniae]
SNPEPTECDTHKEYMNNQSKPIPTVRPKPETNLHINIKDQPLYWNLVDNKTSSIDINDEHQCNT